MSGRMIGAMVWVFLWPAVGTAGTVIWRDGFETGLGNEWTSSSGNFSVIASSLAFEGSRYLNVVGPSAAGGDTLLLAISSVGYEDLLFEGWRKIHAGLESNDRLAVEWTIDGIDWQTSIVFSGLSADAWTPFSFNLPVEANDNPNLAFRWLVEFDGVSDRMPFDNLSLSGVPEPASLVLLALGLLTKFRRRL